MSALKVLNESVGLRKIRVVINGGTFFLTWNTQLLNSIYLLLKSFSNWNLNLTMRKR